MLPCSGCQGVFIGSVVLIVWLVSKLAGWLDDCATAWMDSGNSMGSSADDLLARCREPKLLQSRLRLGRPPPNAPAHNRAAPVANKRARTYENQRCTTPADLIGPRYDLPAHTCVDQSINTSRLSFQHPRAAAPGSLNLSPLPPSGERCNTCRRLISSTYPFALVMFVVT